MLMFEMLAGRSPFDVVGSAENPDQNTEDYLFQGLYHLVLLQGISSSYSSHLRVSVRFFCFILCKTSQNVLNIPQLSTYMNNFKFHVLKPQNKNGFSAVKINEVVGKRI